MESSKEAAYAHVGQTRAMEDHDHDMVHELSRRIDCLWRYDQYVANAENLPELQALWRELKAQEQRNVAQLKQLISRHVQSKCF